MFVVFDPSGECLGSMTALQVLATLESASRPGKYWVIRDDMEAR
jgi:hypothetical protein